MRHEVQDRVNFPGVFFLRFFFVCFLLNPLTFVAALLSGFKAAPGGRLDS